MNVARLLYVGNTVLGYKEPEIFEMTLRKFYLIHNEHLEYHNLKKDDELDLDSL